MIANLPDIEYIRIQFTRALLEVDAGGCALDRMKDSSEAIERICHDKLRRSLPLSLLVSMDLWQNLISIGMYCT